MCQGIHGASMINLSVVLWCGIVPQDHAQPLWTDQSIFWCNSNYEPLHCPLSNFQCIKVYQSEHNQYCEYEVREHWQYWLEVIYIEEVGKLITNSFLKPESNDSGPNYLGNEIQLTWEQYSHLQVSRNLLQIDYAVYNYIFCPT